MSNVMAGTNLGPIPPRPIPRSIYRCSNCYEELYPADNGYGSTRLACPNHGWSRQILTIPLDVEEEIKRHPKWARGYVDWLLSSD